MAAPPPDPPADRSPDPPADPARDAALDSPHSSPDPARDAALDSPDSSPDPARDAALDPSPDPSAGQSEDSPGDPAPDPERARRTSVRLLLGSAALTAMVGLFQLGEIVQGADQYGAGAWLGVAVAGLSILGLIALYGACGLNRATLRTRLIGKLDLFQVATVLLLVAIAAGILIPTRNTTALALLLPWGITYWVHGLSAREVEAPTSDET